MKKRLGSPRSPSELEQSARLTVDDIHSFYKPSPAAADLLRQLHQAQQAKEEREQIISALDPKTRKRGEGIRPGAQLASTAAEAPPLTNRGGKSETGTEYVKLVLDGNKILEVPKRRSFGGNVAFIDWITFTFGEETLDSYVRPDPDARCRPLKTRTVVTEDFEEKPFVPEFIPVTPEEVAISVSNRLYVIFGFGITSKRENGVNFYRDSYVIGDGYGFVGHGGQRGTVMVLLNGTGLAAAAEGWETRLKVFLEIADRAKITRVDLAHDDYTGETYSVDIADQDHTDGLFNCGGRNPDCEHRGNWKNPNGKGRTFNIGNRKNGKFARVYEKGRELGDKNSEWVRIEVEFKSVDRQIPFDILLEPGAYLAEAYPAFNWLSEVQHRILTTQKKTQLDVEKALEWLRKQCGSYIHWFKELMGSEELISRISRDDKIPACFKVPHFSFAGESIHERIWEKPRVNLHAAASAW